MSSKQVAYVAIVTNLAIALAKYFVAAFTGSSAMLAKTFTPLQTAATNCFFCLG
jgi:divalent metal cation (Fe/Co/Zn/Cd) transporter